MLELLSVLGETFLVVYFALLVARLRDVEVGVIEMIKVWRQSRRGR